MIEEGRHARSKPGTIGAAFRRVHPSHHCWRIFTCAGLILSGVLLVLQAAISDCVSFDPFSFQQDGLGASKVDVSRCEITQALVIAAMVVVIDECVDLGLEV